MEQLLAIFSIAHEMIIIYHPNSLYYDSNPLIKANTTFELGLNQMVDLLLTDSDSVTPPDDDPLPNAVLLSSMAPDIVIFRFILSIS